MYTVKPLCFKKVLWKSLSSRGTFVNRPYPLSSCWQMLRVNDYANSDCCLGVSCKPQMRKSRVACSFFTRSGGDEWQRVTGESANRRAARSRGRSSSLCSSLCVHTAEELMFFSHSSVIVFRGKVNFHQRLLLYKHSSVRVAYAFLCRCFVVLS